MRYIEVSDAHALRRAEALALELGVPLGSESVTDLEGVKLIVASTGLSLGFVDKRKGKPFVIDFLTASWRSRFQQPLARNHIFRRALGVRDEPLHVIDATAGFGQDAALAASLGCTVIAVDRSAVIVHMLRDAIARTVDDEFMRAQLTRLQVVHGAGERVLEAVTADTCPDVVYIDPMFDKPKKSAKSPKEMQLLQDLFAPAPAVAPATISAGPVAMPKVISTPPNVLATEALDDPERLLTAALASPCRRVVVKRPLKTRALQTSPSHSFKGQSIRYDVYVK